MRRLGRKHGIAAVPLPCKSGNGRPVLIGPVQRPSNPVVAVGTPTPTLPEPITALDVIPASHSALIAKARAGDAT